MVRIYDIFEFSKISKSNIWLDEFHWKKATAHAKKHLFSCQKSLHYRFCWNWVLNSSEVVTILPSGDKTNLQKTSRNNSCTFNFRPFLGGSSANLVVCFGSEAANHRLWSAAHEQSLTNFKNFTGKYLLRWTSSSMVIEV